MKKILLKVTGLLISITIALLIGEVVSRLYLHFKKFPKIVKLQGMERKVTIPIPKIAGMLRIAYLGDSYTYGFGIKIKDNFPIVVEKILSEKLKNRKIQSLNFGRKGANTEKELTILKEKILKYKPDIIVFGFVLNDFTHKRLSGQKNRMYRKDNLKYRPFSKIEKHLKLFYFIDDFIFTEFSRSGEKQINWLNSLYNPNKNERFGEMLQMLEQIFQIISSHNGIVLFFPHFIKGEERFFFYQEAKKIVQGFSNKYQVDFVEILSYLKHKPFYKWWLHPKDHHPNVEAHSIIANQIVERILKGE